MKCLIFVFPLLLMVFAGSAQYQLTYKDARFKYVLSMDSVLSGDSVNYDRVVKSITIFRIQDEKMIQVITLQDNHSGVSLPADQLFILEDMNFDGVNDIRLVQFIPAAPNIPYYFWLYDVTTKKFVRNKGLEKITSPRFDSKKKQIFSFWRNGCCGHGLSTYKYSNGHLILIEESEVAVDPNDENKQIATVRTLRSGKWKVRRVVSPVD